MNSPAIARVRSDNGIRRTIACAIALPAATMVVLVGCGGGGTVPPPTTTTLAVSTSWSSQGTARCTDSSGITWQVEPISVQTGPGRATADTVTQPPQGEFFPTGGRCTVTHTFTDLALGRWRVSVNAGIASGSCEKQLPPGWASADLSNRSGC